MKEVKSENWKVKVESGNENENELFFAFLLRQVRIYLDMINTVLTSGAGQAVQVR